ncbi:hypothetical protein B0T20DRAFT_17457 [Sordaria brevicollis]|uniref:Uncharacterized protein n=1 Tax=Sordaria brevicollis TaxID=83679 RepID=A0AAE0UGF0_SORBR|nr:hypothetical protein B0T20DRAFT_17457 [Sordaria brevicollis]
MDTQRPLPQTHIVHAMYGSEREMGQRDGSTTQLSQNGHFTFLEEHYRSSSVYDEIVDSYSATTPKSHKENSSTVRNVSSQSALRHGEWPTRAPSRNRPLRLRPPPRHGPFFDAFRDPQGMAHLKPSPLSVSRPAVETPTRRQSRPRSSSVPLDMPRQAPSLTLFPRIDPAPTPTPTLAPKCSYPSDVSSSSPYPASSTAVGLSSTKLLLRPPVPPKDSALSPPRPFRKDTPSLPPLKIPSSQKNASIVDISMSMRNPIKGPALYTQSRPCPSLPTPNSAPTRSPPPASVPSQSPCPRGRCVTRTQTHYTQTSLAHDQIPRLHNILVSFFTWLLLVAFIIITGSFTSSSESFMHGMIQPLFIASLASIVIGITGCVYLSIRWRKNYVWLVKRLYMPLVLNGLAGVFATLTGVYGQHGGMWCLQSIVAIMVESVVVVLAGVLFGVYNFLLKRRVTKGTKVWVVGEDVMEGDEKRGGNKEPYAAGSIV